MGALAGIGDSLVVGTLLQILLGIALGLSGGGSPLGAIFYILAWNIGMFFIMRFMYFKGYELGGKAVEILVGERANAIRESIIMLGTMVIGGVTASWINITTVFKMLNSEGGVIVDLQKTLNDVYPSLLSAVFGLRSGGVLFIGGIVAAILGVLCFLLTCVVDLSIRNGYRNVKKF